MSKETVILLHGIFRGSADMWPMQKYLEYQGYKVLNLSYPARRRDLDGLTEALDKKLKNHRRYDPSSKLHFVGHSLGGLLARHYLLKYTPSNMGRVIMMGTPNTGSEWADMMMANKILRPIYKASFGPVGPQLATTFNHPAHDVNYDLGIISGTRSNKPFANRVLPGDHDGTVSVERSTLPGMKDHVTLYTSHTYMIWNKSVMQQVKSFLKDGQFSVRNPHPQPEG